MQNCAEELLACMRGDTYALGSAIRRQACGADDRLWVMKDLPVEELIGAEARLAWYARVCAEPVTEDLLQDWQRDDSANTYDHVSCIMQLMEHYKIPAGSNLSLGELYSRARNDIAVTLKKQLREGFAQNPQAFAEQLQGIYKYHKMTHQEEKYLRDAIGGEWDMLAETLNPSEIAQRKSQLEGCMQSLIGKPVEFTIQKLEAGPLAEPGWVSYHITGEYNMNQRLTAGALALPESDFKVEGAIYHIPEHSPAAQRLDYLARTRGTFILADLQLPLPQVQEACAEKMSSPELSGALSFGT